MHITRRFIRVYKPVLVESILGLIVLTGATAIWGRSSLESFSGWDAMFSALVFIAFGTLLVKIVEFRQAMKFNDADKESLRRDDKTFVHSILLSRLLSLYQENAGLLNKEAIEELLGLIENIRSRTSLSYAPTWWVLMNIEEALQEALKLDRELTERQTTLLMFYLRNDKQFIPQDIIFT